MALGNNHVTNTTAATFIPELWSDEIIAAYKQNLVLANTVTRMPMKGKKGDTIHIPKPTRGNASLKAEETQVTLIADTEDEVIVNIDKHYEYSRFIEDITEVQALASMRKFYTDDAGYALARQVDSDLFELGKRLGDGTGSDWEHNRVFYANATNDGLLSPYAVNTVDEGDVFEDTTFRALIQILDDSDVPMDNRFFCIPPSLRNTIMGINRYQSSDFVDGRGVQNGKIGVLYGVDIYVSTNVPVIETAAGNSASSVDTRGALLAHKDAYVLAEQMAVRSQSQYKQEYLSTLFTSDTLYGTQVIRPEAGVVLAVPN